MATFGYAKRKLKKWAGSIEEKLNGVVHAEKHGVQISVSSDGRMDEISYIYVRRLDRKDHPSEGYWAGEFCDNVTAALRMAASMRNSIEQDAQHGCSGSE